MVVTIANQDNRTVKFNSSIKFTKGLEDIFEYAFKEYLEIELLQGERIEMNEEILYTFNISDDKIVNFKKYAQDIMNYAKCEQCGVDYEKPAKFKKYNEEHPNVFFRWSLSFCDKCRREKELEALKSLPKILNALSNGLD